MTKPWPNQIKAANEVVKALQNWHKVLLQAPMQSGKTGACIEVHNLVAQSILNSSPFARLTTSDYRYLFITGIPYTDLKNQTRLRCMAAARNVFIEVYNNNDLQKGMRRDLLPKRNSLIIVDESHWGSGRDSTLDKALTHMLGVPLKAWKGGNDLRIVFVSATDWVNEMYADIYGTDNAPIVVDMPPGPGYIGVGILSQIMRSSTSFRDGKKMHRTFHDFLRLCLKQNKFAIVRCGNDIDIDKLIQKEFGTQCDIKLWDQRHKLVLDVEGCPDDFNREPSKPTIVLIKHLARVGLTLNKRYISGMWDSPDSETDTVMQSLLGRMCGYYLSNYSHPVHIYCDAVKIDNFLREKKIESSRFDTEIDHDVRFKVPIKIGINHNWSNEDCFHLCPDLQSLVKKYPQTSKAIRDASHLNNPHRLNPYVMKVKLEQLIGANKGGNCIPRDSTDMYSVARCYDEDCLYIVEVDKIDANERVFSKKDDMNGDATVGNL